MNIKNMNKEQIIKYALEFNIFKVYDFPDYLKTKQEILDRLNELNIPIEDVDVTKYRTVDTNHVVTDINIK